MAFLNYRQTLTPTLPTSNTLKTGGLTSEEIDANFKSLDEAKLEISGGNLTGSLSSSSSIDLSRPLNAPSKFNMVGRGLVNYHLGSLDQNYSLIVYTTGVTPMDVFTDPYGLYLYTVNLIEQNISRFALDNWGGMGNISYIGQTLAVGAGPVKGVFHPSGNFFYVLNAEDRTVSVVDHKTFTVSSTQSVNQLTGFTINMAIHPTGAYLYVTDGDSYAVYSVNSSTGALTHSQTFNSQTTANSSSDDATGGYWGFGMEVHPSGRWMYLLEYSSGIAKTVETLSIDPSNGHLSTSSFFQIVGSESNTPYSFKIDKSGNHLYLGMAAKIYHFRVNLSTGALTLVKIYAANADLLNGMTVSSTAAIPDVIQDVSPCGNYLLTKHRGDSATSIKVLAIDQVDGRLSWAEVGFNSIGTGVEKFCFNKANSTIYVANADLNRVRPYSISVFSASAASIARVEVNQLVANRRVQINGYTSGNVILAVSNTADNTTLTLPNGGGTLVSSVNIANYNAGTATKLATARTLTVGATGKTFDGSANVTWSLTDIGAAGATGTGASGTWGISITGNAATVTNGVYTNTNQTISGAKTFSSTVNANNGISMNAASSERTINWTFTGRNSYLFGRDSDDVVGLYDTNLANSGVGGNRWTSDVSGNFVAAGNVTSLSDARLKTDINKIDDALNKVRMLNGYSYTRTDTRDNQIGLIAQEVQEVLPEVVVKGDYLSIAYGNMMALLVEAIKEQQGQIEELKQKILHA